jgi:hypothetical protein
LPTPAVLDGPDETGTVRPVNSQPTSTQSNAPPIDELVVDDETDGGGWIKVLEYEDKPYRPTVAAVGILSQSSPTGFAKLSDADINALAGSHYYLRFKSSTNEWNAYLDIHGVPYSDTSRAMGYTGQHYLFCVAQSVDACQWKLTSMEGYTGFDSRDHDASAGDEAAWFADTGAEHQCYNPRDNERRCFNCGAT